MRPILLLAPLLATLVWGSIAAAQIEFKTLEPLEGTAPGREADAADGDAEADEDEEDTRRGFKRVFRPSGPQLPDEIAPIDTSEMLGAELRQLDKLTGQTQGFRLAAGNTTLVARLEISLQRCLAPSDGATRGTQAYLAIRDTDTPTAPPAFEGWMFADSPALSALDHPRYDVWVISCTTSEGAAASGSE